MQYQYLIYKKYFNKMLNLTFIFPPYPLLLFIINIKASVSLFSYLTVKLCNYF
jgi:hypothetical protein